jgi:hypothetical protein
MGLEELVATWPKGALVTVARVGQAALIRPAIFVFERPGGFWWVEPWYDAPDQQSTSNPIHSRDAKLTPATSGTFYFWTGPTDAGYIEANDPSPADSAARAAAARDLDWYFRVYLASTGRTLEQERARVKALGPDAF